MDIDAIVDGEDYYEEDEPEGLNNYQSLLIFLGVLAFFMTIITLTYLITNAELANCPT